MHQAGIYLTKVSNGNTTKMCEFCSKLTIKTPEWRYWMVLVSLLLTLNRFHILFWCIHCWLWTSKCWGGGGGQISDWYDDVVLNGLKLTIKLPEWRQSTLPWCFIVNSKNTQDNIQHINLSLLLITLNMYVSARQCSSKEINSFTKMGKKYHK